eukprot:318346-Prymnesium_polylepis.1
MEQIPPAHYRCTDKLIVVGHYVVGREERKLLVRWIEKAYTVRMLRPKHETAIARHDRIRKDERPRLSERNTHRPESSRAWVKQANIIFHVRREDGRTAACYDHTRILLCRCRTGADAHDGKVLADSVEEAYVVG